MGEQEKRSAREPLSRETCEIEREWKKKKALTTLVSNFTLRTFRRIYIASVCASLCLHSNGKLLRLAGGEGEGGVFRESWRKSNLSSRVERSREGHSKQSDLKTKFYVREIRKRSSGGSRVAFDDLTYENIASSPMCSSHRTNSSERSTDHRLGIIIRG